MFPHTQGFVREFEPRKLPSNNIEKIYKHIKLGGGKGTERKKGYNGMVDLVCLGIARTRHEAGQKEWNGGYNYLVVQLPP